MPCVVRGGMSVCVFVCVAPRHTPKCGVGAGVKRRGRGSDSRRGSLKTQGGMEEDYAQLLRRVCSE